MKSHQETTGGVCGKDSRTGEGAREAKEGTGVRGRCQNNALATERYGASDPQTGAEAPGRPPMESSGVQLQVTKLRRGPEPAMHATEKANPRDPSRCARLKHALEQSLQA